MRLSKMNRGATLIAALSLLLFTVAVSIPARAQVSGATLSGIVTDASGGAVPGAKVSIKNQATGVVREVTTNADGFYSAPNLLPGDYEVTTTASGFSSQVQQALTLTVGAEQALNPVLQVGQLAQTVRVSASAPAVQTSTSTMGATISSATMRELPLNGRDWTSLATLEPGVIKIPNQVGTAFNANKGNRGFGNQLSDAGHRANENTYRVNGIAINDYSNGAPGGATGTNLGVDTIQEFSVLTSNYTAEYGRTSGAVINAITKSGVNNFHGTGFFFDRDKIFDAKNRFDPPGPIPSFRRIQFGGSAGGPIVRDRTFIYGGYEGIRQNQPLSRTISVPSDAQRSLAVPAVQPYLALYPTAPAGTPVDAKGIQRFNVALAGVASENYYTTRVDQKISDRDALAGSYFWDSGPQSQPDPLQNTIHQVFSRRQMFSIEETHIFSPQVVNTFRAGYSRVIGNINSPVSGSAAATSTALAIAPGATATPEIRVAGLTNAIGLGGLNRFLHTWNSLQFYDDAFVTRGKHSTKIGFAFEHMQYDILEKLSPNGRFNQYKSLADLLANKPNKLNALAPGGSNPVAIRESLFAGYIQDDWRARSNLTLNMGLRYEATTLPKDANNKIQEITTLTNCTASPTACGPVTVKSFIARNPTVWNFEPRIGFSWDPFKNGKTAVRAGFGVFDVLPLPYEFGLNTSATAPYQIIGADSAAKLGTPSTNVSFNPTKIRNRYIEQNPRRAEVLNWNFNIQREIAPTWTALVGYVGSRSVHLSVASDDINMVQPMLTSAGLVFPCDPSKLSKTDTCATQQTGTRVNPNWGGGAGIRPVIFDGASSYEGFQAQIKKTMTHGFQGQTSYTYGKCRDLSSSPVTGDTYVNSIAVPILSSKQYRLGPCDFDVRQALVGSFVWGVPGPSTSRGFASHVLGGWELGTIVTATTGSPFTPTVGAGGDPLGTGYNGDYSMDFATRLSGCDPIHGGVNYLNTQCFSLPLAPLSLGVATAATPFGCAPNSFPNAPLPAPAGFQYCSNLVGNAGRNSLYGPGLTTVDFSVFKNTHVPMISETFNIQFRAEFFNILNHANLAAPNFLNDDGNNSIFNVDGSRFSKAGLIGSTSTTSRQIQFGLKLTW